MNETKRFEEMREKLFTGVICDALDELGYSNQAMRENINPLSNEWVIVGRAKTMLAVDVYHIHEENPYGVELEAIDSVKPNEIMIVSTNESRSNGTWGELLSTATMMRGGKGAIIDGLIRDTKGILELDFPVFAAGCKPVDSRGRGLVIDYDCPVKCGGVMVHPGDVIFADRDGIVVIPKDILEQVLDIAFDRASRENSTRQELLEGKSLTDVYNKYGVL